MTEQVAEEAAVEEEKQLLCEQELSNLLQRKDYVKAVGVALTLDQPYRILTILQGTMYENIKRTIRVMEDEGGRGWRR